MYISVSNPVALMFPMQSCESFVDKNSRQVLHIVQKIWSFFQRTLSHSPVFVGFFFYCRGRDRMVVGLPMHQKLGWTLKDFELHPIFL